MSAPIDVLAVRAKELREAEEAKRDAEYRAAYAKSPRDAYEAGIDSAHYEARICRLKHEIAELEKELAAPRLGDLPNSSGALTCLGGGA